MPEYQETDYEVVEPVDDEQAQENTDSPTDPEVETQAPQPVVVENYLSDDEQKVQEQHEALAADLAPGETLPWVAEPPSGVAEERAVEAAEAENSFPADEDAEGVGSDVPSSRHETVENPPDTE